MSERRTALITGGGTGVGAACARQLAGRGWNIAVNYSRSAAAAGETVAACEALGVQALALEGDVADDADCRRLVDGAAARFGRLDALVCSAGTTQFTRLSDLEDQNASDFQRVFAVNVLGAYQMARAAGPWLRRAEHGAIVNVSSIAGLNGNGSSLAYITSKGALNSLTLALARLLAPEVRVNAVLPGMIDTGWFAAGFDESARKTMKANFAEAAALGIVSSAEDIAAGVVFLAADALTTTGQLIVMDAGYLLGRAVKVSK